MAASSTRLSQAEIAKGLWRTTTEIYRMPKTLIRRSYVSRSPEGDRTWRAASCLSSPETRKKTIRELKLVKGEERINNTEFEAILRNIREKHYSHEPGQTVRGMVILSFPIFDPFGHALASRTCPFLERIDNYMAPGIDEVTRILASADAEIGCQINGL